MDSVVDVDHERLTELCRRWQIRELSLFGSRARGDARPDSDVDILVTFAKEAPWSAWDLVTMIDELSLLFERPVDLVEERAIRNPFRRAAILRDKRVIYEG